MSTFNLDWQVDTSQVDKLLKTLQSVKPAAEEAATSLDKVGGSVDRTKDKVHEFSLANAGVVRELSVMFGEAMRGNWSRLEGSMTVLANRTGLLAMAFSPVGALIGGAVAAVGLLAVAAEKGSAEEQRLATALVMTGNAAGSNAANLRAASLAAGEASGNLTGAKEAIAKLTESGRFSEGQMRNIGTAAAEMSRVTGQSVDKIVAEFVKLGDEPAKASLELNKQYHYLTAAIYEQITSLERQGRTVGAAALAEQTYSEAMKKRADEVVTNLGYLPRAANAVKQAFVSMWDSIMGVGRSETSQDRLKKAQDELAAAQKNLGSKTSGMRGNSQAQKRLDEAKAAVALAEGEIREATHLASKTADKQAESDGKLNATAWWDAHHKEFLSRAEAEKEEIANIIRNGQNAGKSQQEIHAAVAGYRSKHKGPKPNNSDNNAAIEALRGDIQHEQQLYDIETTNLQTALTKQQITQHDFDQQKLDARLKMLQRDMDDAQKAADIATKKGDTGKAEHQHWVDEYNKFKAEMDKARADYERAESDHAKKVEAIWNQMSGANAKFMESQLSGMRKQTNQQFMTANQRSVADTHESVNTHFNKDVDDLNAKLKDGQLSMDDFYADLAKLEEERKKANDDIDAEFQHRLDLQGDWTNGAKLAFQEYAEAAQNTAAQTKQLFTNAFSGMENALVTFATTGKLNFKSLASSVITDLVRMEVKAEETKIFGYLGQLFGFGSTTSGAAIGGVNGSAGMASVATVAANGGVFGHGVSMYASGDVVNGPRFFAGGAGLMGEAGPEAIMPLKRGADGRLGVASTGGNSQSQIVSFGDFHFTINGNIQDEATAQAMQQQMVAQLATVIADQRISNSWRTGGLSYTAART
jgi:lambda family phage tail tape measure protein